MRSSPNVRIMNLLPEKETWICAEAFIEEDWKPLLNRHSSVSRCAAPEQPYAQHD
jgi:hypothetical protein